MAVILLGADPAGTMGVWAIRMRRRRTLILEALFDVRAMVSEIHAVIFGEDDEEEEEEEDS